MRPFLAEEEVRRQEFRAVGVKFLPTALESRLVASHIYGVAAWAALNMGSYVDKNQLFIERRAQGDYAVRKPDSERASAVLPTQAEAIAWAKEHNPKATPMIERVRNTKDGHPDKWRKP